MIFGLLTARLEAGSLSCDKNASRSFPLRSGYCNKKQYLCYMTLMENLSIQLFFFFVETVYLAFFSNLKHFLIKVNRVFIISKKTGSNNSKNRVLAPTSVCLPYSAHSREASTFLKTLELQNFHISVLCRLPEISADAVVLIVASELTGVS